MTTKVQTVTLESLEPASVWRFFAGMSNVPRPSKKEERIRKHILDVAKEHGLAAREDQVGNVIVDVPATKGHEGAPITVLQGHLDMVCEKNSGTTHDFDSEPIHLVIDEDPKGGEIIVRADGTTLGADNGIGVALALAAAISPEVTHGPLELLFTLDEESGMTGAKGLTPESFKGRRLLNLDSEEDDALYIGCAGGSDINLTWRFKAVAPCEKCECCRVVISGLRGGHSGCDIHEGRGSAIKLLTRALRRVDRGGMQIGMLSGGSMRNAIPREAEAIICGPADTLFELEEAANRTRKEAIRESGENDITLRIEPAAHLMPEQVLSTEDTQRLIAALASLPHGVLGMHPKVTELVETSNNIATLKTDRIADDGVIQIDVGALARSSSSSRLHAVLTQITAIGKLSGASVNTGNEYPGWDPNPDSSTLATCRRLYSKLFEAEPTVMAIHAGLECGLIGERVGDMDMISFGPRIEGAHSPDERVYVASVLKTWGYLKAVLAELART